MKCPRCGSEKFLIKAVKTGVGEEHDGQLVVDCDSVEEEAMEIRCDRCYFVLWTKDSGKEFPFPEGWAEE